MYDEIKTIIWPNVEFVQGIPLDLEKDSYLDPTVRNMIVLDDLITTTSKDPRITDLFTEGSHHRNVSVVVLNQNMYFSKDPTQRRNCHYLFLFNNPVDKQSIMTLAKQMYPGKTQYFLEQFEQATRKPFQFLLVDLKTATPEHLRLRHDILNTRGIPISNNNIIPPTSENIINDKIINEDHFEEYTSSHQTCQEELTSMISCDDCGILFENLHDLQRHIKTWCPEQNQLKRKQPEALSVEIEPSKKPKLEQPHIIMSASAETLIMMKMKVPLSKWPERVITKNGKQKLKKYMMTGLTEEEAMAKAEDKLRADDWKIFMNKYATLIGYIMKLQGGKIHTKIMDTVSLYNQVGYDEPISVRMALKKYRYQLEEYLEHYDYPDSDSESDDDDDDNESNADNEEEN
jgi:hypothetical protein